MTFQDRLLSTYNRLQSDSHFRRRKNLEELQENYVRFATDECYPNLVQIFHDYNQWIKERSNMIQDFERIQQSYQKQCEDIMNYVEMIDELRQVVYKNIRELVGPSPSPSSGYEDLQAATTAPPPGRPDEDAAQQQISSGDDEPTETKSNKTLMTRIRGGTKKRLHQAEDGFLKLDHVIRQLRTNIQKK